MLVAGQIGRDEARRVGLDVGELLELELHARYVVHLRLHQLLDVGVEVSRRHLRIACCDNLRNAFNSRIR